MHFSKPAYFPSRSRSLPTGGLARHLRPDELGVTSNTPADDLPPNGLDRASVCAVSAYEWTCRPEWKIHARRVGDDMWFFVRSGSCRYRLGNQLRWNPLREGSLLLIPQGVVHAIEPATPRRRVICNTVHFFFRGSGGMDLLRIWDLAGEHRSSVLRMDDLNRQLAVEFALKRPGWLPDMNAYIWQVMVDLIRSSAKPPPLPLSSAHARERIQPVLNLIDDRLSDPDLRVPELARSIHVSEAYLRRLFLKALECGVVSFIQRRRLDRASQLLIETNRGLKEIAAASGFLSQTLFHRLFLRRFGMTPGAYRQGLTQQDTVP